MNTHVKHPNTPSCTAIHQQPSAEDDLELFWLFEAAETAIATPSSWEPLVQASLRGARRAKGCTLDDVERRADALHRATTIVGWLEKLPASHSDVLVAAYLPRSWPEHYHLTFGRLAGVVATIPSIAEKYRRAIATGQARACGGGVVAWLQDAVVRGDDTLTAWAYDEAVVPYARALKAYHAARGRRPSLIGPDA